MKRYRRSLVATTTAASLLAVAGACSGSDNTAGDDDSPVDLTMTVWTADEEVIGTYETMAEEFREIDPRLGSLTVQSIPFDNYLGRLTTQLSGGDAPDLGWLVEANIPALAEAGALVDVGDALHDFEGYDFDDIVPGTLTGVEREDGLFGYPFASTTHPIIVNTDLFAAAGVDSPVELFERGEWTWENLARVSRELVQSGAATYGFDIPQFQYSQYTQMTPFLKAFGAEAWPEGTQCGYDSPEAVEAVEFIRTMAFVDDSFPAPGETSSFPTGDTGMYLGPPSTLNNLTDAGFAFDLVPQPEGSAGFDPFFGQAAVVAFSSGDDIDVASDFLAYISTTESSRRLMKFFIPPRASLLTPELVSESNPMISPAAAQRSLIDTLDTAEQLSFPLAIPELESAIRPVMDGLWQPEADVAAVLAEVCDVAEPILESQ